MHLKTSAAREVISGYVWGCPTSPVHAGLSQRTDSALSPGTCSLHIPTNTP